MKNNPESLLNALCVLLKPDYFVQKEKDPGGYSFPYVEGTTEEERQHLQNLAKDFYQKHIQKHLTASYLNGYTDGINDCRSKIDELTEEVNCG